MESICGEFLLKIQALSLDTVSMTDWQICDWYTSTSGLQLCGQHLRDKFEPYKQVGRLGPERLLHKHDLSTQQFTHSHSSLKMNSSSRYPAQRTDYISPNRQQRL